MINDEPIDIDKVWPVFPGRQVALQRLGELIEDPEAAQTVWDTYVAPLYDRMAAYTVYDRLMHCKSCGVAHPAHPTAVAWAAMGKPPRGHAMHCLRYTGPLEHRPTRLEKGVIGYRHLCTCGTSYPADADPLQCPDAALDWRGPRPVQ